MLILQALAAGAALTSADVPAWPDWALMYAWGTSHLMKTSVFSVFHARSGDILSIGDGLDVAQIESGVEFK